MSRNIVFPIRIDTLADIQHVLIQCRAWLVRDAIYTHKKSNVRALLEQVERTLIKIKNDEENVRQLGNVGEKS